MDQIQVAIEGPGAEQAAIALLALAEVQGSYQVDQAAEREGTLATIATIVGIIGGGIAIGEKLHQWYHSYRTQDEQTRIEQVLIVTPTSRLLLEDATIEEIANALKPLAKNPPNPP